ncbi:replication-associated protein [robinz virus RP_258]|nr:replication-associated protein [robinz virus RP_258]
MLTTNSAPFDFHAKRAFLTYAQCGDIEKEDLRDFLVEEKNVEWYIIGKETHADGGLHLHAYVEWTRQQRIRDARHFDFREVHPNWQPVRRPVECQKYCVKDGDYIANMEIAKTKRTYGEIIAGASSKAEFLVQVEEAYPRDMVINLERVRAFAEWKYNVEPEAYVSNVDTESWIVPEELERWFEDNVVQRPLGKRAVSLFLCGETRTGKTAWARGLGAHSYFGGIFNLDDYNPQGRFQIFDDFEWKYLPNRKSWFGGQLRFTVTDKYRHKRTIDNGGRPSIFLSNNDNDPRHEMTLFEKRYYANNAVFIDIFGEKLFKCL